MPAVSWSRADAATNSATPAIVMQALVAAAKAQGWTVDYADTNAIGTGTSTSPKFDTVAYSSGVSIGIVILKMALNGFSTQWVVKIEPVWGTVSGAYQAKITTGLSQSGGVLNTPGSTITCGAINQSIISFEYWVSAHINELLLSFPTSFNVVVGRKRDLAGTTLDDIYVIATGQGPTYVAGYPAPVNAANPCGGLSLVRNVTQGEYTSSYCMAWINPIGTSSFSAPPTLTDSAGNYGYPMGPFIVGNGLGGFPRLMAYFPTNDVPAALNNFTATIDGADRLMFVTTGTASISIGSCRMAYAKE